MELIDNHTAGIYQIKNLVNGKVYDGQAKNLYKRNYRELSALKGGYFHNTHLQRSWDKYGGENFELIILVDNCDESELDDLERANILFHDAIDSDYGYNKTEGGESGSPTDETRKKQSESLIKYWEDPNKRLKQSETKKKMFATGELEPWNKGIKCLQISESITKKWEDPEYRLKVIESKTGKKQSEETRKKRSESITKKWEDPEYRLKQLESREGENNPAAILTEQDVYEIKSYLLVFAHLRGFITRIARVYGVAPNTIGYIKKNKTWTNVKVPGWVD
jgi:group I intron endonuclease